MPSPMPYKNSQLQAECQQYASPELINHGPHAHPKARITRYLADYHANVDGPLLAQAIGLSRMREQCPHFNRWLTTLEQLDCTG